MFQHINFTFDQALALGDYVVLMPGNAEQVAAGADFVGSIKTGGQPHQQEILHTFAMTAEEARKFRCFKKIIQRRTWEGRGEVLWLRL